MNVIKIKKEKVVPKIKKVIHFSFVRVRGIIVGGESARVAGGLGGLPLFLLVWCCCTQIRIEFELRASWKRLFGAG